MWIPEGKAGTRATLHQMAELVRRDSQEPAVQQLAEQYPSPILIDQFFRLTWAVVPDPDEYEFVRAPKLQAEIYLESGTLEGDCDDASTLSACLLRALRWPCVITAIRRPGEADFSHVFTTAYEAGY